MLFVAHREDRALHAVARALAARGDLHDVQVFTNGLRVALELEAAIPRISVIVTGGTLRPTQHSLVNPLGTAILDQIHAHLAFVGCDGIEAEAGVTNTSVADAEITRLMLRSGRRRIVVADGSTLADEKLSRVLTTDPGFGVIRHADAGYAEAIACATARWSSGCAPLHARQGTPRCAAGSEGRQPTFTRSTTKTRVSPPLITPPAPRLP